LIAGRHAICLSVQHPFSLQLYIEKSTTIAARVFAAPK
jgi:hypothetical protein